MSQLFLGKGIKPISVFIEGLDIRPVDEKRIVFNFSSETGDYKFTMNFDQKGLRNVAQLLAYPPADKKLDHLVLELDPDGETTEPNHKIALDKTDRDFIETILKNAPSLLHLYWLTEEDAQRLFKVFEGSVEKIDLDPDRN